MSQVVFSVTILYSLAVTMAKLSIVITYLRIFPTPKFRWSMYGTATVIAGMGLSFLIVSLSLHWDWLLYQDKLDIALRFSYVFSSVNALTDFVLVVAPMPLFWKLQMPNREKIAISILFAMGIL